MNTQLLKRLYSIYSPSGKEQKMMTFLCSYIKQLPGNISVSKDKFGNLYVIKGEAETYPCLVSHIDQVSHCNHSKDFKAVETREVIFGYSPKHKRFENLGADDKNGVFICLECLKKYDAVKVVFFREEETGCKGSSEAVMSFFDDVRFVIQPDRKGNSDLITNIGYSDLCSEGFMEAIEPEKWGYMEENGLMTDILALKENGLGVSCINVSCGYYNAHSDEETTMKKDLLKCRCTQTSIHRYLEKISQPILDRIDICVEAPALTFGELNGKQNEETSAAIQKRVAEAQDIQRERYRKEAFSYNSQIPATKIREYCALDKKQEQYMEEIYGKLQLTARSYHKLLRVARTLADMDGGGRICDRHLEEAICYRSFDRKFWER